MGTFNNTRLIILISLGIASCGKEVDSVDNNPIAHGWEVTSITPTETGLKQVATNVYLVEFTKGFTEENKYLIDFDRNGCGGNYTIPKSGVIRFAPPSWEGCSNDTQYAHDVQGLLLASTSYSITSDSTLLLFGASGEIRLKRSLDCAHVGCQKNWAYVLMTIKRKDGSDVFLTSSKLIRLSDNQIINSSSYPTPHQPGLPFTLIDDSYRKNLAGKKVAVEFQGFINDTMVLSRIYTITADCCHVSLVSGDVTIVLD
jgi:hypothetical protein